MFQPKVAVHLITWGKDWLGGMAEAQSLGFTACETFTHNAMEFEDRIDEFKEILEKHGFILSALYAGAHGGHFCDLAKRAEIVQFNAEVARFLQKMGTEYIVFGPGSPRRESGTTLGELKVAAKTIDEAGRRCYDLGVKACVHPHMYTEIQSRLELDVIMEETDPRHVFFCPDTAHLFKAGMDPAEVIRTYGDRIAYAHLKDVTPDDPLARETNFTMASHDEALPIFCELGLGPVDFTSVMHAFEEIDYDGWLTVEIDKSTSTPLKSLTICREFAEDQLNLPVQGVTYGR